MARYVTNAGGATHIVTDEDFARLSSVKGFRAATPDEIARWQARHLPARDSSAQSPGAPAEQPVLPAEGGGRESAAAPGPEQSLNPKAGAAKRSSRKRRLTEGAR